MRYRLFFLWMSLFALLGCANGVPATPSNGQNGQLEGRILVWHGWEGQDAAVLESQIATFRRLYPNMTIAVVQVPPAELLPRYSEAARLGLGPDLLIGRSEWLAELVTAAIVQDISAEIAGNTSKYFPTALAQLRYNAGLYGLPLALRPTALYYNRTLVATPAATLDELLQHATDGHVIALSTRAESAYWGITAFGPPLIGADGALTADHTGLVGWLNWLKRAQDNPNVILSQDEAALEQLFAAGQATYYVGSADLLAGFKATLEETAVAGSVVGVAPLPSGANSGQPLLDVDALYFNAASSSRQYALALVLADFLTNTEQGTVLLRELGRVPASQRVRVNNRLYPLAAVFAQQGRVATHVPQTLQPLLLGEAGDGMYTAVLSGVRETDTAVCEYMLTIRQTIQGATPPDLSECGS